MRKINKFTLILFTLFLATSTARAGWQDSFLAHYTEEGLNVAVTKALAEGISPLEIVETAMTINGITGEVVAAAVCDGGVDVQYLEDSLQVLKISQQTAINICKAVSASVSFPGSSYSSVSKRTNYDGSSNRIQPASGHNFN